jgi:hypothetical protein
MRMLSLVSARKFQQEREVLLRRVTAAIDECAGPVFILVDLWDRR